MSESIWTRCAGPSEIRPLESRPWRVVEAQHVIATRKLVDSAAEHEILEDLIETVKPPHPPADRSERLHYLLSTPFRYPPLRHGSRFGARFERGLWYGSEKLVSAFAEVAYYRLIFLEDTDADLGQLEVEVSTYRAQVKTPAGIDLCAPPFASHSREISSPISYTHSQQLGHEMREAGVEALRYRSARDAHGAANIALFSPSAFAAQRPSPLENWHCSAAHHGVDFTKRDYFVSKRHHFSRETFLVDDRLPRPAV